MKLQNVQTKPKQSFVAENLSFSSNSTHFIF